MGEHADDILDGSCCQFCGCYFKHSEKGGIYVHEHPVVCLDCWDDLKPKEKKNYIKAERDTY